MATVPDPGRVIQPAGAPQVIARISGLAYLVTILAGGFEQIVRSRVLVPGDPAATLRGIDHFESLYRLAVAADVVPFYSLVTVLLYVLLKPVSRTLSLFAAFLSLLGGAVGAFNAVFALAPLVAMREATLGGTLSHEQVQVLAVFFLGLHEQGFNICLIFFGLYCTMIGAMFAASGLLPRVVSGALAVGGFAYFIHSLLALVSPGLAAGLAPYALALGAIGESAFALWLLICGVNTDRWWTLDAAPTRCEAETSAESRTRVRRAE